MWLSLQWAEMFEVTGRRVPAELTQARLTDVRRGHEWTIRDKLIQFRRRFSIGDPDIQDDEIPELSLPATEEGEGCSSRPARGLPASRPPPPGRPGPGDPAPALLGTPGGWRRAPR